MCYMYINNYTYACMQCLCKNSGGWKQQKKITFQLVIEHSALYPNYLSCIDEKMINQSII